MPVIKLGDTNSERAYVGVVSRMVFFAGKTEQRTHYNVDEVPLVPDGICILVNLLLWSGTILFFFLSPRIISYEDKVAKFQLMIVFNIVVFAVLKFLNSKTRDKRTPYQKTIVKPAKMKVHVTDYKSPAKFEEKIYTFECENKSDDEGFAKGQTVAIFENGKIFSCIHNLTTGETLYDDETEAEYKEARKHLDAVRILAYYDPDCPEFKPVPKYNGRDCFVDEYEHSYGAKLGPGFWPWTSYVIGTASITEDREPDRDAWGNSFTMCDFAIYRFDMSYKSPLATQRLKTKYIRGMREGNIIFALMQGNKMGYIVDLKTDRIYDISENSGVGRSAYEFVLLNETERKAAFSRHHLMPIVEQHVERLLGGGESTTHSQYV